MATRQKVKLQNAVLNVRLYAEELEAAKKLAEAREMSLSDLIRELLASARTDGLMDKLVKKHEKLVNAFEALD